MEHLSCDYVTLGLYVLTILIVILLVIIHQRNKIKFFDEMGIRCEPTWPIVGIFPELLKDGILEHDLYAIKQYGTVYGSYLGNIPNLVVADPKFIKEIFVRQFNNFPYRMKALYISPWWENGVVIASGGHWRYLRSLISPAFSTGKLKQMHPKIVSCLDSLSLYINEQISDGFQVDMDIRKLLSAVTMKIICSTSFGVDMNAIGEFDDEFAKHAKIVSTLNIESNALNALPLIIPSIRRLFELFDMDYVDKNSLNYIKNIVSDMILSRKMCNSSCVKDTLQNFMDAHKTNSEMLANSTQDIKEYSLGVEEAAFKDMNDNEHCELKSEYQRHKENGLNNDELLANSIIVLMAGYDTTATTVTWMSYLLATNQHVQKRLLEEIDNTVGCSEPTYSSLAKMEYLDWFLSETLRLFPAANRTGRESAVDTNVYELKIPKGTSITVPIHALHRMPEYWKEPEQCIPERFSPENRQNINPYAYIPFGVGPRACVGIRMAQMLCKMIMVKLLQNFCLETNDKTENPPVLEKSLLTKPLNGMHLKIIRRAQTLKSI